MATEMPHKQEFRIRDLTTRSVLLFPTRAQVIRDVKDIKLEDGPNQIVIDGLDPSVDEHSIKVEGTGSATITEVTVDLLPNREVFEDIYPSDAEDEEDDDDDDEEDEEVEAMKTVVSKIKQLNVKLLSKQESINSAAKRLLICDNFSQSITEKRPPVNELETLVQAYQFEREKIYRDHEIATDEVDAINEELEKAEKEKLKVAKAIVKATEKKDKEKAKLKEKKIRHKAEIFKEKQRIKAERESFWPKKVYRVTINLEPNIATPGSSRRNSIDGDTIVNLATSDFHDSSLAPLKHGEINLSLSYITYSASWSPRYDMSLNSIKCTGVLEYGAELRNTTSEIWKDAKVILSTSQTTVSGLSEEIPTMVPWHVRLQRGAGNAENGLFSTLEIQAKHREWNETVGAQSQKPRWEIYGRDNSSRNAYAQQEQKKEMARKNIRGQQIDQLASASAPRPMVSFGAMSLAPGGGASFNKSMPQRSMDVSMTRSGGLFGASRRKENMFLDVEAEVAEEDESDVDMGYGLFDRDNELPVQTLTFEEGAWEESGMTTTYEVPGLKTLTPSNSASKQKIAKIEFRSIVFSHIIVGKLRQVAFLKARLRNTSKITLLKGPLGLTLDRSFLGQTTFPRCSAGEAFSLPLGVDPAINVTYMKPTVRRSQTGIFNKEDSNVFTRVMTITNTKNNVAAEITVLDQVPVSEDERLKIDIVQPKGLRVGAEPVKAGFAISSTVAAPAPGAAAGGSVKGGAKDVRASVYSVPGNADASASANGKTWGTAIATTKKGGEVSWNVKLNPGQAVKLVLEYEAAFPSGEAVVST